MALSWEKYAGSVDPQLVVPFPYLSKSHVKAYVNGVLTANGWNGDLITLIGAYTAEDEILIRRETPYSSRLVTFNNHSILSENDQNRDSNQMLYTIQELLDEPAVIGGSPFLRGPQGETGAGGSAGVGEPGAPGADAPYDNIADLLTHLTGLIGKDQLVQELQYRIDLWDTPGMVVQPGLVVEPLIVNTLVQETHEALDYAIQNNGRITQAEIDINAAEASITLMGTQITALQTDTGLLTGRISQAEIDIDGAEAAIALRATIVTTDGLNTRVTSAEETLDAGELQWTVKLNADNRVAGVGLWLDPYANKSEFVVLADMFKVVNPSLNTDVQQVFTVGTLDGVTGSVGINGDLIIDGTIRAGSIIVGTLSALTADMGTLTAGTILQGYTAPGNNDITPGAGLKISDGKIEAYGSGHAFGAGLVASDGDYLMGIGKAFMMGQEGIRYPLINDTNFGDNGNLALYRWTGSAWHLKAQIGVISGNAIVYAETLGTSSLDIAIEGMGLGSGAGVYGYSVDGKGVIGTGYTGYGAWFTGGKGAVVLRCPSATAAAPTHAAEFGTLWLTTGGVLYINVNGSTTWQKVGAQ